MMKKQDLFKLLTGEYGEGRSFRVSVKWVKENDREVYEHLLSIAENRILHDDWLVEYTFNDIDGEIEIIITAGEDRQMLNNQPAWIHETITLDEFLDFYEYEKYIKQLK
ncbi:hypothetical protein [Tepidimicrobium xylanilyticum]